MALSSRNSNFTSGVALEIYVSSPGAPAANGFVPGMIDYASLLIAAGPASGSASFLVLGLDGSWRTVPSVPQVAFSANSFQGPVGIGGVIQGPVLGWQAFFTVSSGVVQYAELSGTVRP